MRHFRGDRVIISCLLALSLEEENASLFLPSPLAGEGPGVRGLRPHSVWNKTRPSREPCAGFSSSRGTDIMHTLSALIHAINRAGAMHWDFASAVFVQVVALVAILGLVELCLRRRVRPVVRYWLWALVILKLMLPVALRTPASLAYWVRSESPPAATIPIPAADVSPAPRPLGTPQDFGMRPVDEIAEAPPVSHSPIVATPQRSEMPSIRTDAAPAAVALPQALPHVDVYGWLFLAWCGGCLVLGGIVIRRAAKVRRLVQAAAEAPREFGPPLEVACASFNFRAAGFV